MRRTVPVLMIPFSLLLVACGGDNGTEPSDVVVDLLFATGPGSSTAGNPMSAIRVHLLNSRSGVIITATDAVTLSIGNNPGNGTLSGTTTVNAVNGSARFEGLSISAPGSDYTLVGTSGMVSKESRPFIVDSAP